MTNAWGPLGNPTKEDIQKWWELPYGQFTQLRKEKSKKPRGKPLLEHTLYVVKEVSDLYVAEVKIMAKDMRTAQCIANGSWDKFKDMTFSERPVKEKYVSYSLRSYKNW